MPQDNASIIFHIKSLIQQKKKTYIDVGSQDSVKHVYELEVKLKQPKPLNFYMMNY